MNDLFIKVHYDNKYRQSFFHLQLNFIARTGFLNEWEHDKKFMKPSRAGHVG